MGQQVLRGANGTFHEISTTVWAGVFKQMLRAIGAKRTFIRTNSCVVRRGRQVRVTPFAVRLQYQHSDFPFNLVIDYQRFVWHE